MTSDPRAEGGVTREQTKCAKPQRKKQQIAHVQLLRKKEPVNTQ